MFVDASALLAILARELEASRFLARLESTAELVTSPIAFFETVANLCRIKSISIEEAQSEVEQLLKHSAITIIPIDKAAGDLALAAFARFGKGRGHPAQLNLGDCFAYGMAKARGVPLLYKGSDFAQTDVEHGRTA